MTLHHLQVFCSVCEEGSMTKAAVKLNMTQPGVSRIISELEGHYKVILFLRKGRSLMPTPQGSQFYHDSKLVLQEFHRQEMNIRQGQRLSSVVFGCTTGLGFAIGSVLANDFKKKFPACRLSFCDNTSRNIQHMVVKGECNLAMVQNVWDDDKLIEEAFYTDRLIAVASPSYQPRNSLKEPLDIKNLAREDLLLMEKGRTTRNMIEKIAVDKKVTLDPIWTSAAVANLKELALQNRGITVIFEIMVRRELRNGTLVRIPTTFSPTKTFYLIRRKDTWISEEVEYLLSLCRQYVHS